MSSLYQLVQQCVTRSFALSPFFETQTAEQIGLSLPLLSSPSISLAFCSLTYQTQASSSSWISIPFFSSVSNTNPLHSSVSLTSLPSSTFSPPQALATTTIYAIIYASSPAAIVSSSTVAPVSSSSKNSTLEAYAAGQDYSNYSFTMLGTSSHPLSPSHHLT